MLLAIELQNTWEAWRALKKLALPSGIASGNSYASFVLSKLPTCYITRQCTLKHEPIVNYCLTFEGVQCQISYCPLHNLFKSRSWIFTFTCKPVGQKIGYWTHSNPEWNQPQYTNISYLTEFTQDGAYRQVEMQHCRNSVELLHEMLNQTVKSFSEKKTKPEVKAKKYLVPVGKMSSLQTGCRVQYGIFVLLSRNMNP